MNADERKALAELGELEQRPTAAQRTVRTGGQAAGAYVVLDAAQAFDWFGVAGWSPAQMKAGSALMFFIIAAVQNLGPKVPGAIVGAVRWVRQLRSSTA